MQTESYSTKKDLYTSKIFNSVLPHIDIELTERCNNACIHCYINQPISDQRLISREMDFDFVKSILTQAANLGCFSVRFTGGEPLIRPDFPEIYMAAKQLGMQITLFTNARLITPKLIELFQKFPPKNEIVVTIYGLNSESYDAVAGCIGAYNEYAHSIELLRQNNIPFLLKSNILPPNKKEQAEIKQFAKDMTGLDGEIKIGMNFTLRARRDLPNKNKYIQSLRLSPEETVKSIHMDEKYLRGMGVFASKYMKPAGSNVFSCGAGEGICVDSYGNIQMCLLLRHPDTIYQLKSPKGYSHQDLSKGDGTLKDAITRFLPELRKLPSTNIAYLNRCAKCFLNGLCEHCPGNSWMEHGTLDTPVEYFCDVAHALAFAFGLIKKGEKAWTVEPTDYQNRLNEFFLSTQNGTFRIQL